MMRAVHDKGAASRFRKVDRGLFEINGWPHHCFTSNASAMSGALLRSEIPASPTGRRSAFPPVNFSQRCTMTSL